MIVRIASGIAEQLLAHATAEAPREACGLLLGQPTDIRVARPARNVAARPEQHFEIDPAMLLAEHRSARGKGMAIIGHYHSHPNGSTTPSKRDAARALQNDQIWIIVGGVNICAWEAVANGALHGRFNLLQLETV